MDTPASPARACDFGRPPLPRKAQPALDASTYAGGLELSCWLQSASHWSIWQGGDLSLESGGALATLFHLSTCSLSSAGNGSWAAIHCPLVSRGCPGAKLRVSRVSPSAQNTQGAG